MAEYCFANWLYNSCLCDSEGRKTLKDPKTRCLFDFAAKLAHIFIVPNVPAEQLYVKSN